MTTSQHRRRTVGLAAAVVGLLVVTGCGGGDTGDGSDVEAFHEAIIDTYGASSDQAACISGYVLDEYAPAEVETIRAEGISALPLNRWEPFFNTVVACLNQTPAARP